MRICHVLESTGGGSAQVVLDLLRAGAQAGDDLTLIYSPLRAEPHFIAALEELKAKVHMEPLAMQHHVGVHDARSFLQLTKLLRRIGPFDIIHSHSSKAGALTRMTKLLPPRTKHVYTPHAFMSMAPDAPAIYGYIEKMLSGLADMIICVSEQEKRHAIEHLGIAEHRLHVVHNGVQLDYPAKRDTARAQLGFGDDDFVVGFVGRLVPQKNPLRMVDAFAFAAMQQPALRLAIVGDGILKEQTEQALKRHGLSGRTHFFARHKGQDLMPGFDCLVCSSDYESFGLVILEALAAGLPVISTPVGIAEDAIISGKNGFIVPDFTAGALAGALATLALAEPATREAMSDAASAQAKEYSIQAMEDGTRAIYAKLLNHVS